MRSIIAEVIAWLRDNLSDDFKDYILEDIYVEKKGFKLNPKLHQYKTRIKAKQPYRIVRLKIKM